MFVDGTLVGSVQAAADLLGIDRTTLWHLVKRGEREYKGHTHPPSAHHPPPEGRRAPPGGRPFG